MPSVFFQNIISIPCTGSTKYGRKKNFFKHALTKLRTKINDDKIESLAYGVKRIVKRIPYEGSELIDFILY